jgi:hypothetical protein
VFLFAALIFISCGENEKKESQPENNLTDSGVILKEAKKLFGENVQDIITGSYTDTSKQYAVLTETANTNVWGITFNLMGKTDKGFGSLYKSELLSGSFKESEVKNIRISGLNYDLVYYNSRDYFLGSGGGEIFSYIIDFKQKQTYYAHLIADGEKPVSLFISKNNMPQSIKDFFIKTFRNDYPAFTLVNSDIELE